MFDKLPDDTQGKIAAFIKRLALGRFRGSIQFHCYDGHIEKDLYTVDSRELKEVE